MDGSKISVGRNGQRKRSCPDKLRKANSSNGDGNLVQPMPESSRLDEYKSNEENHGRGNGAVVDQFDEPVEHGSVMPARTVLPGTPLWTRL